MIITQPSCDFDTGIQDVPSSLQIASLGQNLASAKPSWDMIWKALVHLGPTPECGSSVLLHFLQSESVMKERIVGFGGEHFFQFLTSGHRFTFQFGLGLGRHH